MSATFEKLAIPGAFLAVPRKFRDSRGTFFESWMADDYAAAGVTEVFQQDNVSISGRKVLRGLHYQVGEPQGQLVTVVQGKVFDVLVDLRVGSPAFGESFALELDAQEFTQLYMPPGVAHGFCVIGEGAVFMYKSTKPYVPEYERGLNWSDPSLGIRWPVADPVLSPRDAAYPLLSQIDAADLPVYSS